MKFVGDVKYHVHQTIMLCIISLHIKKQHHLPPEHTLQYQKCESPGGFMARFMGNGFIFGKYNMVKGMEIPLKIQPAVEFSSKSHFPVVCVGNPYVA